MTGLSKPNNIAPLYNLGSNLSLNFFKFFVFSSEESFPKKDDVILAPFLGTGTSAAVAKKLGRKYFGIERDKKYFKAANDRINKTKAIEESHLDALENNKSKPRVPFGSLVELGIIKPGTSIFDQKKKINAKIMVDGSIKHKESAGSIHKIAAKIMGTESYNGWTYWHYNIDGTIKPIDNLRQRFLSKNV